MTKKVSLYKSMRVMAIVPLLLIGVVITVFCYLRFKATMYDEARDSMRDVANLFSMTYEVKWPGDYELVANDEGTYELTKGGALITDDYSVADEISKKTGYEISLLYMDIRVHTSFMTESGTRLSGLYTNAETSNTVLNEQKEIFYKDVDIVGTKYLVLYVPVMNHDAKVVGMIEVAKPTAQMTVELLKAIWPILLLAFCGIGFAIFLSYKSTQDIVKVLDKIRGHAARVSDGNLAAELDTGVLNRKDELGDMGRSITGMQKSIRYFVETDPLTGLNNRRYVNYMADKIISRNAANGMPFSVAIGDIDFFKKVNDTYGHNAGDEVLKDVAKHLRRFMTHRGFVARWGGEEFVMVFDHQDSRSAEEDLMKLLDEIREMVVRTEGYEIQITMTFGVTDGAGDSIESMVEIADQHLYYGKQHGRNQVVRIEIEE